MSSNHLIFCHPLLLLPSVFPSIRVFSNESALGIRRPKYYWSFSFSISPPNKYSGLISFRTDWFTVRVSVKQDAVCHCTSTVNQRGTPVYPFCLPSDALPGAIVDRTGVGLGTHWSHVDSGTFLCDPGAIRKAKHCPLEVILQAWIKNVLCSNWGAMTKGRHLVALQSICIRENNKRMIVMPIFKLTVALEKEMATHSSTSCFENPMDGGAWCRLLSMGSQRVGHDWATSLHFYLLSSCYELLECANRLTNFISFCHSIISLSHSKHLISLMLLPKILKIGCIAVENFKNVLMESQFTYFVKCTSPECTAWWIVLSVHTQIPAPRWGYETAITTFPLTPHPRQPLSWLLSPFIHFGRFWTSYKSNYTYIMFRVARSIT